MGIPGGQTGKATGAFFMAIMSTNFPVLILDIKPQKGYVPRKPDV